MTSESARRRTWPYSRLICRGSYALRTACGHCERCEDELHALRIGYDEAARRRLEGVQDASEADNNSEPGTDAASAALADAEAEGSASVEADPAAVAAGDNRIIGIDIGAGDRMVVWLYPSQMYLKDAFGPGVDVFEVKPLPVADDHHRGDPPFAGDPFGNRWDKRRA